jgi:hypothetical protein
MKDDEKRGVILRRLYDLRVPVPQASLEHFEDLQFDNADLFNILEQLAQEDLIEWLPHRVSGVIDFFAKAHIKVLGVKVIEGTATSPVAIKIINVQGSHNVIGDRNIQTFNLSLEAEKIVANINSTGASITEKEEAKSLFKKVMENPLVKGALEWWAKSHTGT